MIFRIKEARKAARLTQKQLSEKLGISVSTLSGYEIGAHDPKSNILAEIAQICGVTVDFLLGIERTAFDDVKDSLGTDTPAAKKLRQIGDELTAPPLLKQIGEALTTSPQLRELYRAIQKMTPEEQQKMLDVGKALFPDRFLGEE